MPFSWDEVTEDHLHDARMRHQISERLRAVLADLVEAIDEIFYVGSNDGCLRSGVIGDEDLTNYKLPAALDRARARLAHDAKRCGDIPEQEDDE